MAKRSFRGKPKKKKAPGGKRNPQAMLAQMQQMQADMATAQKELENETVTISSGGGAVTVTITGHQRVQSIKINPELVAPEEIDMLEDMVTAAVNQAIEQSQAMSAERMEGITGGMGGGLNDLLGGLGLG